MRWAIMEIYRIWITTFLKLRVYGLFPLREEMQTSLDLLYRVFYLSQILWRMLGAQKPDAENHCAAIWYEGKTPPAAAELHVSITNVKLE